MCLIIYGPSALIRSTLLDTPHLIEDIYRKNADGLGIMFKAADGPRVHKWLPKSLKHAIKAVESFPQDDREMAVHWRWRTHGDINAENCHPYPIDGGFFMHNGVLETGNKADPTKSDTWHYGKNFLTNGVMDAVAHNPQFLALLTDHIGSGNKFVMLTADGRMSIAGRHRGIDMRGLWWSNTYAWEPATLDPTWVDPDDYKVFMGAGKNAWKSTWTGHGAMYGAEYDEDFYDEEGVETWKELLEGCMADEIADLLDNTPYVDLSLLLQQHWKVTPYQNTTAHPEIMALVLAGNAQKLAEACNEGRTAIVAEVLAYYTVWDFGDEEEEEKYVAPSPNYGTDADHPLSHKSFNESYAG